jgi:hypothetical protein
LLRQPLSRDSILILQPIIQYTIIFDGDLEPSQEYASPIVALEPLNTISKEVPYTALAGLTGNGDNDLGCQKGAAALRFPIYLESYNVSAILDTYNTFNQMMIDRPAFNNSFFLIEGYSTQAVRKIPSNSTAYAHRTANALL